MTTNNPPLPSRYTGPEAVDAVFDSMPPKENGVGYGTIFDAARKNGYNGAPARPSASEMFATYNAHAEAKLGQGGRPNHYSTREKDKSQPPQKWLIKDHIPDDGDALLAAPSKYLKSFLAAAIAGSVATGLPLFGKYQVDHPGDVFLHLYEGAHSFRKKRMTGWEIANGLPPFSADRIHIAPGGPLLGGGNEDEFITDALACMKPGEKAALSIFDTLNRALNGADENSSATASIYLNMLARVREAIGGSTLTLHHMGKDETKGARGSSAFYAGFDTVFFIDNVTKDEKTGNIFLKAHIDKQKDGEDGLELYLRAVKIMTPDGPSLALELASPDDAKRAAGKQVGLRPKDVGAALKARGACPGGANEWNSETGKGGIDTRRLAMAIAETRAEATGSQYTEKDIGTLVMNLNRDARNDGPLSPYVVRESQSKRQWAIAPGPLEGVRYDV